MPPLRSGLLAAWGSAWLAGRVGYDELAARVTGGDDPHRVADLDPAAPPEGVPLLWALCAWRERGATTIHALCPAPGDPRGLAASGGFAAAAMTAAEAVVGADLGLVPEFRPNTDGGAATMVRWRAFPGIHSGGDWTPCLAEAEQALAAAVESAADTLMALRSGAHTVTSPPGPASPAGSGALPRRRLTPPLPPGHDPRAVRLLVRAERVAQLLTIASAGAGGRMLLAASWQSQEAALRPVRAAVRWAQVAAYNARSAPA